MRERLLVMRLEKSLGTRSRRAGRTVLRKLDFMLRALVNHRRFMQVSDIIRFLP